MNGQHWEYSFQHFSCLFKVPATIRKSNLWLQDYYTKWIYRGIDQILGDTHVSKIWQQLHCACTCSYYIELYVLYGWLCKWARWTESCSVIGYPSEQDSSILSCKKVVFFFFHTVCIINPLLTNIWVLYLSRQTFGFFICPLLINFWEAGMVQCWEHLHSTNVAWVRFRSGAMCRMRFSLALKSIRVAWLHLCTFSFFKWKISSAIYD